MRAPPQAFENTRNTHAARAGRAGVWSRALAVTASVLTLVGVAGAGCGGPKYPLCDNDDQCNTDGHTGVCVAGKCVECRDDKTCGAGKTCVSGGCTDIPGFCDKTHACPDGSGGCGVDNRCLPARKAEAAYVEC